VIRIENELFQKTQEQIRNSKYAELDLELYVASQKKEISCEQEIQRLTLEQNITQEI